MSEPLIRNISDTAKWVAIYRARENDRADALFRDPFARRLAGERGEQIASHSLFSWRNNIWPWIARTYLFDQFVTEQVHLGVDMVINLAAGLDARPYRMQLPAALNWVEVDLPEILDYKEQILADERPVCQLERIRVDLADVAARRRVLHDLGKRADNVLVLTEGLLVYLKRREVGALAEDLACQPAIQRWTVDLASKGLVRIFKKRMGELLDDSGHKFKFAPREGPAFFNKYGWQALEVRGLLETAAQLKRLPIWFRLMSMIPETRKRPGARPWSGVCMFSKTES